MTSTSTHLNLPTLLSPTFAPHSHANTLVLLTNNPNDTPIDLTTPLSRALFDAQEIDSHIHSLTSRHAVDLLSHTRNQNESAGRILGGVEAELGKVNSGFERLSLEVVGRVERAEKLGRGAGRGVEVLKLLRGVQRVVNIARTLEGTFTESGMNATGSVKVDHGSLVRATMSILAFREIMNGPMAAELGRVSIVKAVRGKVVEDSEEKIRDWARKVVREFNASTLSNNATGGGSTFTDTEEARARFQSACHVLYLLSSDARGELLLRALQVYVQSAVQASSSGIARGLAALPQLERVLGEVSWRCQGVVGLEGVLGGIAIPGQEEGEGGNLLELLLNALDTASLASYFWRSLASGLGGKVQEIVNRGGVSVRTLRSNREKVRDEIRECVLRGSRMPAGVIGGGEKVVGNWEREAAVMVGSVMGPLGR